MALPASDSFTRANNTTLGANWTVNQGAWGINSNTAYTRASGVETCAHWSADTFNANHYSRATVVDNYNVGAIGVAVRCHASAATWYGYYGNSVYCGIYKVVAGGAWTALGADPGGSIAANDVLQLLAYGTTIDGRKNRASYPEGPLTDSTISSGSAGLAGYDSQTTDAMDDWSGGDVLAFDSFDRDNNTNIGADWTEVSGTWDITSNKLWLTTYSATGANDHGDDEATWDTALGAATAADYDVECILNLDATGGIMLFGRRVDLSNTYWGRISTVSQYLRLYKTVTGTSTQLGSTYSGGQSTGTDYVIKLSMTGSSLVLYQDDVSRVTATDSALTATGKPALGGDSSDKVFNNFTVYGVKAAGAPPPTIVPNGMMTPRTSFWGV